MDGKAQHRFLWTSDKLIGCGIVVKSRKHFHTGWRGKGWKKEPEDPFGGGQTRSHGSIIGVDTR